jgi:hypothetical protein
VTPLPQQAYQPCRSGDWEVIVARGQRLARSVLPSQVSVCGPAFDSVHSWSVSSSRPDRRQSVLALSAASVYWKGGLLVSAHALCWPGLALAKQGSGLQPIGRRLGLHEGAQIGIHAFNCSNRVNWASCCVNCELSIGERILVLNWATRSFIKVSLGLSFVMPWAAPQTPVWQTMRPSSVPMTMACLSYLQLLTLICSQAPCYGEGIYALSQMTTSRRRGLCSEGQRGILSRSFSLCVPPVLAACCSSAKA